MTFVLPASFSKPVTAPKVQRNRVAAKAVERDLWCPGATPPPYLDGSLAGDCGFDPAGIAKSEEARTWLVQAELQNMRWAMLAQAGILIPGLLTKAGILNVPEWYDAGEVAIKNGPFPFGTLIVIEVLLFAFVEMKRIQETLHPGSQAEPGSFIVGLEKLFSGCTGQNGYPGGIFDPLGFSKGSEAKFAELKLKEINNGRTAMLAMLGCFCQYSATGKGPLTNLADHIADPLHQNYAENGISVPFLYGAYP